MPDEVASPLEGVFRIGHLDVDTRHAMIGPGLMALVIGAVVTLLGPWPVVDRLVLVCCLLTGSGLIAVEFWAPWDRFSPRAHLLVPALGMLVIGVGMWATGGWSSPLTPFLALAAAYAVAATNVSSALPLAVLAGLVTASPGLYCPDGFFWLVTLGAVPAYIALVVVVGVIMDHSRSSARAATAEAEARRQSEMRAQDLLTLQHISAIVGAHLSMDEAISAIVHELSVAFGHSLVSLYLADDEKLCLRAQVGYESFYDTMDFGQGVIGTAYVRGETIFIRDARVDPLYIQAEAGVVGEIAVPLRYEGATVGVLNVESHQALTDRDRDLMELFSAQVSVVLRNARLAGELRLQAEQDPLTGLLNHRALVEKLSGVLRRDQGECAVLVIDLDNFKQVNDTYGHLIGDGVLNHVAGMLTENCRTEDACGRFGGDEFVVVLPGVGRTQALVVAHRILSTSHEMPFLAASRAAVPLSLSIGLGLAPEHGTTWQELLAHADQEMYQIKRARIRHEALSSG